MVNSYAAVSVRVLHDLGQNLASYLILVIHSDNMIPLNISSFYEAVVIDMTQKSNLTCKLELKLKLKVSWKFSEENISDSAHSRVELNVNTVITMYPVIIRCHVFRCYEML